MENVFEKLKTFWYVPLIIALFIFFQAEYKMNCSHQRDQCIIQKKVTIVSEFEKIETFNILSISDYKIKKKFNIASKKSSDGLHTYYLSLDFYNFTTYDMKFFDLSSEELVKDMYKSIKKNDTYEIDNIANPNRIIAFWVLLLLAGVLFIYKKNIA